MRKSTATMRQESVGKESVGKESIHKSSRKVHSHNDSSKDIVIRLLGKAGITVNGDQPCDIQVKHPQFFRRVISDGSLGLGESYMDGWWECERLDIFFHKVLRARLDEEIKHNLKEVARIFYAKVINMQSRRRAWQVGKAHYDLGNTLFEQMLDPYMQYSCGYWADATNLDEAQANKLKLICHKLQFQPGMRLLDIGCGWGGLAEYAAKNFGVSVVGLTISAEQQKKAQERTKGLDVDIRLQDYRDLNEMFDRVVSVGMFEHVGPKNYGVYFKVAANCLKDEEGLFLLHTIGKNQTVNSIVPWITKYIFPNGFLPSPKQVTEEIEPYFVMEDWHNFGQDYDRTLMSWYENFKAAWDTMKCDYDERFYRMFTYYLECCAGAFRARQLQLWQVLLSPRGVSGGIRVPR